jgi:hypothetical protein
MPKVVFEGYQLFFGGFGFDIRCDVYLNQGGACIVGQGTGSRSNSLCPQARETLLACTYLHSPQFADTTLRNL